MEHFLNKEQFTTIKATWSNLESASAASHIVYNLLRSLPIDRGFVPFKSTNTNKISSHNNDPWNGFNQALYDATIAVTLGDTTVEKITESLPRYLNTPEVVKDRQKRIINNNTQRAVAFFSMFGIELTVELSQQMYGILGGYNKK